MDGIAINQLLVLMLQYAIVGSLTLVLFRLRSIFGLSLLFASLIVFQYQKPFLVTAIYIEIMSGIEVFQISMVLFIGSLISELSSAIMYSFIFWVYLILIDKIFFRLEMNYYHFKLFFI